MVKRFFVTVAVATFAVFFSACSSVQIGTTLNDQRLSSAPNAVSKAHINGHIWGIYLFNIPLISGSSSEVGKAVAFKDTANIDNAVDMVTRTSAQLLDSTEVVGMSSFRSKTWIFPLLIIWLNEVEVSGNAIR